tara:strand:- start:715 stop:1662 length:948 start_codon:yes stop_codon:yes gene_type:complete
MKNLFITISKLFPNTYIFNFVFLQLRFLLSHGRFFNFKKTYRITDYIQYSKLHSLNDFANITDKIKAKKIIGTLVGENYVVKTLFESQRGSNFENKIIKKMPKNFVIKFNHNASGALIYRDGFLIDVKNILFKEKIPYSENSVNSWLKTAEKGNLFYITREPQYLNIEPRWYIEELLQDGKSIPDDVKVHCIKGIPEFIYFALDRENKNTRVITDNNQNILNIKWEKKYRRSKFSKIFSKLPKKVINQIIQVSRKVSKEYLYIRIDFYVCRNEDLKIGELTLHHGSGFDAFKPDDYDIFLGKKIFSGFKSGKFRW